MLEPAAARLTVEVVAKKRRMGVALFKMLMGDQSFTPPEDEIQVKDRATGVVIYREAVDEGPGVAPYRDEIQHDLDTLDIAAFCAKYNVTGHPTPGGSATS
jgi:hypothetical protein